MSLLAAARSLVASSVALAQAAGLVVVASACGLVYNSASPLGVRFSSPAEPSVSVPARVAEPDPAPAPQPATPPSPYSNDTLALQVQPAPTPSPAPRPSYTLSEPVARWRGTTASAPAVPPAVATPRPVAAGPSSTTQPARKAAVPVTWEQAAQLVREKGALLVDARTEDAFKAGHIPGAQNLPFIRVQTLIADFRAANPVNRPLIVYCSDLQCPVSHSLADQLLNRHGYRSVYVLSGGYLEWQKAGIPQEKGATP